jgi:hypothetical protein
MRSGSSEKVCSHGPRDPLQVNLPCSEVHWDGVKLDLKVMASLRERGVRRYRNDPAKCKH